MYPLVILGNINLCDVSLYFIFISELNQSFHNQVVLPNSFMVNSVLNSIVLHNIFTAEKNIYEPKYFGINCTL